MNKNRKRDKIQTLLDASYVGYKERPVSMRRFLTDTDFLGNVTKGGKMIFPIWKETLIDLSNLPEKNLVVLTGSIGTGKTTVAIMGMAYVLHLVMCLADPWAYFNKQDGGKMAVVFFNLTRTLSASKGFNLLQGYLQSSPWFREKGHIMGSEENPRLEFPIFEWISGSPYSKGYGTLGLNVITALMDEVDSPTESDKQRIRVLKAFESTYRRFENRFVLPSQIEENKKLTIGKFFLVASKQEQLSFLNTFVAKRKSSLNVYIVDIPIWEARPKSEYCGIKFPVKLGDLYTPSEVLGIEIDGKFVVDNEKVLKAQQEGFKIVQVPIEYLEAFQRDVVGALRDFAGISVTALRKSKLFPSEHLLVECYDPAKKNPIKKMTIEVGFEDDVDFANYIDFRAIRIPKHIPRYIHVDIAYSGDGDALGLGMSCISGWTDRTVENLDKGGTMSVEKLPVVETDLSMRIKGRVGDKIPLHKVRKLIIDLKKVYKFNIKLVTFDLNLLSEDTKQILTRAGIECDSLSLDRNPQIYRSFRDLVNDKRWVYHKDEYAHFEFINLEDDTEKNKIDHPDEVIDIVILEDGDTNEVVVKGSKDLADGITGSVEDALRNVQDSPPTQEFIRSVKNSVSSIPNNLDRYNLFDKKSFGSKKQEKPKTEDSKQSSEFKDIFKRSQRKR